ncbi:hypothetical protein FH972_016055 [Carpinus fangiana]|uniref:Bet v I/Major latex protein domain-containing protein n=1 Tax=Carpinus fangiana TaxID=176857 RepID=A0A5N6REN2_9ROSI|nr:hypothetical protein FH972_016055 [Carpinus fangiana]
MHGQLSQDTQIGVPASLAWDVYGGLEVGKLVDELLPDVIGRVEVVEGTPGASYLKERFTVIDDDRRIKETEVIEGGYKDMGFHLYRIRLEIVENGTESSVVRSTIEYDVDDKFAENASLVTTKPLETIAEVVGRYLTEKKATAQSESRSHEHHA